MFAAIGLSQDCEPVELETFQSETHCREWITQYIRWGDFGGYDAIAVLAPCGEYFEKFERESE